MRHFGTVVALLAGAALAHPQLKSGIALRSVADECSEKARTPLDWWIDNFKFIVYDWDYGGSTGSFGFTRHFSGTNTTIECLAKDVDLAALETTWAKCGNGTEFQFSLLDISMNIRETWTCPGSPGTVFTANASGMLMMHGCIDTDTERGLESDCVLMETEMAANVTSSVQS